MGRFIWTIRVEYVGKVAFHSPKVGEIRCGNYLQSSSYGQLLVTADAPHLCDNLPHGLHDRMGRIVQQVARTLPDRDLSSPRGLSS
jgi:hypothetical protein